MESHVPDSPDVAAIDIDTLPPRPRGLPRAVLRDDPSVRQMMRRMDRAEQMEQLERLDELELLQAMEGIIEEQLRLMHDIQYPPSNLDYYSGVVQEGELGDLRPRVTFSQVRMTVHELLEARRAATPRRRAFRRQFFRRCLSAWIPGRPGFGRRMFVCSIICLIFLLGIIVGVATSGGFTRYPIT